MSSFDPASFLNQTVEGSNDTMAVPIPVGEYQAMISKVEPRQWKKKDDPSVSGVALDILWDVQDDGVKQALGRDKLIAKQGVMLDLTDDGQGLDMGKGKNIALGRLREATGLNDASQPFAFSMLLGRPAKVKIVHRSDPKDASIIYSEVGGVTKL